MPHVTPAKGMLIPDPDRHDRLPEEGREVPDSDYWQRRLRDGDVVLTPPAAAPPAPHEGDPA